MKKTYYHSPVIRILLLSLFVLLTSLLVSCGTSVVDGSDGVQEQEVPEIEIAETSFVVDSEAQAFDVKISVNMPFDIVIPDECKSWLSCSQSEIVEGAVLKIFVNENADIEERTGRIAFICKETSASVTVRQCGIAPYFELVQDTYTIPDSENIIEVVLISNVGFETIGPDVDWVECIDRMSTESRRYYQVARNDEYESRKCEILYVNNKYGLERRVSIEQAQKGALIISQTAYEVNAQGGKIEVQLQSNVAYDVIVPVDCSSWIEQLPNTKSLRKDVLLLRISENKDYSGREGYVNIVNQTNNLSETITIKQKAKRSLLLSEKEYSVSDAGEKIILDVGTESNDYSWTVADDVDWITLAKSESGNVKSSLIVNVKPNYSYSSRSAEVMLRTNDGELSDKLLIFQSQHDALLLDKTEYQVGNGGGEITVRLKSNISTYEISSSPWISSMPVTKSLNESNLVFIIQPNMAYEGRTGFIDFKYVDKTQRVTVIQGQTDALIISRDHSDMPWEGGTFSVMVRSNVKYSYSIPVDAANWLSVTPQTRSLSSNEVSFVVSENNTGVPRSSEVVFVSEDGKQKKSLVVSQRQNPVLEIGKDNYNVGSEGGQIKVEVRSNAVFSVSSSNWIHRVSQTGGVQSGILTFSVDENTSYSSRTGFITFSQNGLVCTVTVEQRQKDYLLLSSSSANVPTAGGLVSFSVNSNVSYMVTLPPADEQWIDIKEQVNSASVRNYTLTIGQNDSPVGRSTEIVFRSTDGSLESKFVVTQAQKDMLLLSESEVNVNSKENILNVDVSANVEYKVSVNTPSWISVLSSDNGKLRIAVSANDSFYSRTGRVIVSSLKGGLSSVLNVIQSGKNLSLSVSDDKLTALSLSAEVTFSLETNGNSWNVSSNASWCRPGTTYGSSQSGNIKLRLSENTTEKERTAVVTVTASARSSSTTLKKTFEIVVVQAPRPCLTLTISEIKSNFSQSDGMIGIRSNCVWSAASDASWCQVSPTVSEGDGELAVRLSQNDSDDVRMATITVVAGPDGDKQVTAKISVTQYDRNNFTIGDWETSGEDKGGIAE